MNKCKDCGSVPTIAQSSVCSTPMPYEVEPVTIGACIVMPSFYAWCDCGKSFLTGSKTKEDTEIKWNLFNPEEW